MPSPFPGFDPYLEDPNGWRGFHNAFITTLSYALNERLPRPFVARQDVRLYVVPYDHNVYPDVVVTASPSNYSVGPAAPKSRFATAVLEPEVATPPLHARLQTEPMREAFIEIRVGNRAEPPVTVIELLSPANKTTPTGRAEYKCKQDEVMQSRVHLMEIDLLRGGSPDVTLTPRSVITALRGTSFDYMACLHRGGNGFEFESWPFGVRETMPCITIPLKSGIPDVVINLRKVFDEVYDRELYGETLPYDSEPQPPLSPDDALWANELLKANHLR